MDAGKAIEAKGTIDAHHRLFLDEPLPVPGPTRIRVIILLPEEEVEEVLLKPGEDRSGRDGSRIAIASR